MVIMKKSGFLIWLGLVFLIQLHWKQIRFGKTCNRNQQVAWGERLWYELSEMAFAIPKSYSHFLL